ncbi:MAG: 16S rRNA (cytosine(1402)-N(4))-methyltransferase RsmH [Rickettsiaceae bacterium]|nr:16S rRNA (cytosine(1402)-N(4))-methyltransferase RsmH [Rickettsiaceae bacterium]
MNGSVRSHIPVMLPEVITYLMPQGGVYVDCTFGQGGYSRAILKSHPDNKVIAIDQDPEVVEYVNDLKKDFSDRFLFISDNFKNIGNIVKDKVDGVVFDLGVSTKQILSSERGFSFDNDGPLDMRMSKDGISALDVINEFPENELADLIYEYGDEHASKKIARYIVNARLIAPITTTKELSAIVNKAKADGKYHKINLATKTFQAIRIFVNQELASLEQALADVDKILKINGRIVVVSFHSLEDRIIKNYLQKNSPPKIAVSKYHKSFNDNKDYIYNILTKKPIETSQAEIALNLSARSAKLRAAVKVNDRKLPGNVV